MFDLCHAPFQYFFFPLSVDYTSVVLKSILSVCTQSLTRIHDCWNKNFFFLNICTIRCNKVVVLDFFLSCFNVLVKSETNTWGSECWWYNKMSWISSLIGRCRRQPYAPLRLSGQTGAQIPHHQFESWTHPGAPVSSHKDNSRPSANRTVSADG